MSVEWRKLMSKFHFESSVYVGSIGSGSKATIGAIGDHAEGTVVTDGTSVEEDVIGAIGAHSRGTVIIKGGKAAVTNDEDTVDPQ